MKATNCNEDDSGGFVGELRSLRGVELAIFLSEYDSGEVHISFRSKDWFDCSKLATMLGWWGSSTSGGMYDQRRFIRHSRRSN